MPNVGDLILRKLREEFILGTIVGFHEINEKSKYAKIMWITTDNHPVSVKDFYEDFLNVKNMNNSNRVFVLKTVDDIPNDCLRTI